MGDGFAEWYSCYSYGFILLHCSISIVAVICYIGLVWNYMRYLRTLVRFHRVPEGNVQWERVSRDVGGVVPGGPT